MAERLLIATDLKEGADRTLEVGVRLAGSLGREAVVLHVVTEELAETLRSETPSGAGVADDLYADLRRDIQQHLARVAPEAVGVETVIAEGGRAGEVILEHLESGAYAFGVIGVRSRSRVGKLLLGSTSQHVLLGGRTPIVAVPLSHGGLG